MQINRRSPRGRGLGFEVPSALEVVLGFGLEHKTYGFALLI